MYTVTEREDNIGKFVIKGTKNGGYKFDLLAANQQVIASSQTYKSLRTAKAGCLNGIDSIGRNAPDAETVKAE